MSNIYVIADTHFGHDNIITFEKEYRGHFKNTKEMDEYLVQRWNQMVMPNDVVYHLGDVAFKGSLDIVKRLNGKKHLIMGNHDNNVLTERFIEVGFSSIHGMLKVNRKYFLTHCPMHSVELEMYPTMKNIHGHIHSRWVFRNENNLMLDDRYINVGVELTNFEPIPLEMINQYLETYLNDKEYIKYARNKVNKDLIRCQQSN